MRRICLISVAMATLVSGCASVPPVRAPHAQPPAAFESRQPTTGAPPAQALDSWWTLYGDRQLDELVAQALANSPTAEDAIAKLEQAAEIRTGTIEQLYLPSTNLSGTATKTHTDIISSTPLFPGGPSFTQGGDTTSLNANFSASWELDLFGRRAAGRQAANADFYSAAFTYEATRTSLAANVAQSLFDARGIALQLADAQETLTIDNDLLRVAKVKFEHGLTAEGDLDQAIANARSAEAQVHSLDAQLTASRRLLLVLIGKGFDPLETLKAQPDIGTPPPIPAQVPGDLLRRRPDVRAAEERIISAMGTLKVDELAVLPTLKIEPGVTLAKSIGPLGSATAAWSIGAALTQPVLDRPRLIAQMHAQRAVAEQDVIAYEQAVQTAYGDTENALNFLQSDAERVVLLTEAEARARAAYDKAQIGYERGFNDLLTALTLEAAWRNIRTELSSARTTLMDRSVQVFKALGGGWTPDQPAAGTPYAARAAMTKAEGG
jgi:NodT family efflux transporter outer membrane factor (OMF) lipoprotein